MKVFVAGGSGMVGSSVIRSVPPEHEVLHKERRELDLTDRQALERYLRKNQVQAIIMAAAKVGGILANSRHQLEFLLQNLKIQNAVFEASMNVGIENLVFLGSSCIYPQLAEQPIKETSILSGMLEPTNEGYALAKIAGVRLSRAIADENGFNYFSLMPTNLYGPNDNFDVKNSHVPAALMRRFHEAKLTNAQSVKIWGTGNPKREFMHVDDLASAIWHFLKLKPKGELINIGTGSDVSIAEFAKMISKTVGFRGQIEFDTSKPDGSPRKLLDINKARSLGWTSQIELTQGLEQTYSWFVDRYPKGEVRGY
jgi:GDP-L-fucose synthase